MKKGTTASDITPLSSTTENDSMIVCSTENGEGKRWKLSEKISEDFVLQFPEQLRTILQLFHNRGLKTQREIDEFFDAEYSADVHDPYLFLDMEKAVGRIWEAIEKKQKILVYGDYDADGICSSVILSTTLKKLGAEVEVYIPDRFKEGYGLQEKALAEIIADARIGLVITVDCGVTDVKEVDYLNAHGRDVIIVDHHLVPPIPPAAYAIIDPKREGETYPFKTLCAAGVTFKVACALLQSEKAKQLEIPEGWEKWLLDMVAIASVADMVPLVGESRTFVKYGLIVIRKTQRVGLRTLLCLRPSRAFEHMTFPLPAEAVTAETIAFMIAPRINATSRMDHATVSFELLITEDEEKAQRFAERVEELNTSRRKTIDQILKEAEKMIEVEIQASGKQPRIIVLGKEEWAVGVVGLAAGRLTDKYGVPSFIYGMAKGSLKGSCRGIEGFNVVEVMRACNDKGGDILIEFGGHAVAGGFAVAEKDMEKFSALLHEEGERVLPEKIPAPSLLVEAEVASHEVTWELCDLLARFEPYGQGNKKPTLLLRNAMVASVRLVGEKEGHLKMMLKATNEDGTVKFFNCIGFGLSAHMQICDIGACVDVVFELDANEWNGTKELQLKLKDIRKSL
ncbi:MAG: single-stranded-DNA-specific exonuclease RecJ [Candidatus Azambacteria bacterium]|nr:single-stranded-DNA-specific exonuclease RecJ [Candidatus Azambacteria bacterium]